MTKQLFVTKLLRGIDCKVINGIGFRDLSFNRIAKYTMEQGRCSGDYVAIKVSIIHKENGVIDCSVFNFDDYMSNSKTDKNNPKYHVIDHVKWDWYINIPNPENIAEMIMAMNGYVEQYV